MNRTVEIVLVLMLVLAGGCGKEEQRNALSQAPTPPSVTKPERPKIVAFGDSLTAGLGLSAPEAYPAQLQNLLDADGYQYEVVNAGVSGDTSSGGLRRLDWNLQDDVAFLILELGANDVLRGQPIDLIRSNLSQIIEKAQARKVTVLLAALEAPTGTGDVYRKQVHELYPELAKQHNATLIPFFLADFYSVPGTVQPDGTHPNAKGAKLIAIAVYEILKPLLKHAQS